LGHKFNLIIAIFFTTAIFVGSLFSGDTSSLKDVRVSDKVIHFIAYFLLALSWLLVFKKNKQVLKTSLFVAVSIIIYGIVIEALQNILTEVRTAEVADILSNSAGVVVATLLFNYLLKKRMLIK
jgi:VanZ family protein